MTAKFRILLKEERKTIEADKKICEGIYEVTGMKFIKRNFAVLGLNFKEIDESNEPQGIITKVENIACLTVVLGPFYKQLIFMSTARWEDFTTSLRELLASNFNTLLTDTFYAAKINQDITIAPRLMTIVGLDFPESGNLTN